MVTGDHLPSGGRLHDLNLMNPDMGCEMFALSLSTVSGIVKAVLSFQYANFGADLVGLQ